MITLTLTRDDWNEVMHKLGEIVQKIGPFKIDNYEHALSVMGNSTKRAKQVWSILWPSDDAWKKEEVEG